MQIWLNFWNLIFWISMLGFLINYSNFLFIFLFSETTWIILYAYSVTSSESLDDINLASNTFFILGLAGLEFSIGFLLLILFLRKIKIFIILIQTNLYKKNGWHCNTFFNTKYTNIWYYFLNFNLRCWILFYKKNSINKKTILWMWI